MNIDKELQELTIEFKQGIPDRINIIESLWQKVMPSKLEEKIFLDLHNEIHKRAGTSAAYGLDEISQSARTFEIMLDGYAAKDMLQDSEIEKAEQSLARLKQAVNKDN